MGDRERLAAQVQALSPPDRLRLAAGLLEQRRADLAHTIAETVVLELGAALALARLSAREAMQQAGVAPKVES